MQRLTNRGAERLSRELVPLHEDEIEVDVDVSHQNIMDFYKHSPRFASDRAKQWQWIIVSMSISCLVVISALFAYAVFTTTKYAPVQDSSQLNQITNFCWWILVYVLIV